MEEDISKTVVNGENLRDKGDDPEGPAMPPRGISFDLIGRHYEPVVGLGSIVDAFNPRE
jgi:hypothetical protein